MKIRYLLVALAILVLVCPVGSAWAENPADIPFILILAKDPENAVALGNLGRLAYQRGENARAAEWFRDLANTHPKLLLGHAGLALMELDNPEKAKDLLNQPGLEAGRDKGVRELTASILTDLARKASQIGQPELAVLGAKSALGISGDDSALMTLAGSALITLGRYSESREILERAAILAPEDPQIKQILEAARFNLAVDRLNRQEYESALELLTFLEKNDPVNPLTKALSALALYGMDLPDKALAKATVAASSESLAPELVPHLQSVLYNLGVRYNQQEDDDKALQAFRAAWKLDPSDGDTGSSLAFLLEKLGRPLEAADILQKVVTAHPELTQIQNYLTDLYFRIYRKGLDRGRDQFEAGDYFKALESLRQAVAVRPRDAEAGYYVDRIVEQLITRLQNHWERTSPPWDAEDIPQLEVDLVEAVRIEKALEGLAEISPWANNRLVEVIQQRVKETDKSAKNATEAFEQNLLAKAWDYGHLWIILDPDSSQAEKFLAKVETFIKKQGPEALNRFEKVLGGDDFSGIAKLAAEAERIVSPKGPLGEKLQGLLHRWTARAEIFLEEAESALLQGDIEEALRQVDRALDLKPGWDRALSVKAEATRLQKIKSTDRILARAKVYIDLHEFDLARSLLQEAAQLNPDDPQVAQALKDLEDLKLRTLLQAEMDAAHLALQTGDFETAKQRFEDILKKYPDNREAADGLKEVETRSLYLELETLWEKGQRHLLNNEYALARESLQEMLSLDPENTRAKDGLAMVDAREQADAVASILTVGKSYLGMGKIREAEETTREGLSRYPENPDLANLLNITLEAKHKTLARLIPKVEEEIQQSNYQQAMIILKQALQYDPANPHLQELLTIIQAGIQTEIEKLMAQAENAINNMELDQAERIMAKVLELAPDSPQAARLMALLKKNRSQVPVDKVAAIQEALEKDDFTTAQQILDSLLPAFQSNPLIASIKDQIAEAIRKAYQEEVNRLEVALVSRDRREINVLIEKMQTLSTLMSIPPLDLENYRRRIEAFYREETLAAEIRTLIEGEKWVAAYQAASKAIDELHESPLLARVFQEIVALMTSHNRELFRKAQDVFSRGQDALARDLLLKTYPQVRDKAMDDFLVKVKQQLKDRIEIYLNHARQAFRDNQKSEAFLSAFMALAIDPNNSEAAEIKAKTTPSNPADLIQKKAKGLYFKGVTAYTGGDYQGAIQSWRDVLLLTPDNDKARRNLEKATRRVNL